MRCSLLIPCRNGARFLPRLWETVRAQTRSFDEIWVYDDASEDDSAQVAETLGARVVRGRPAAGAPAARNRLLSATDCEWVHFHDADDTLAPGFLAGMLTRADDRADVVLCDVDWIDDESGRRCSEWRYREDDYREHPIPALIHNTVGGIGGLYRREWLLRVGGFNEALTYWEDTDLHLRLVQAGARFAVVKEVLSYAHRRADSLSNGNLRGVWRAKSDLLARLAGRDDAAVRRAVADDTELIARRQFRLRDFAGMRRSLEVCRRAGGNPPTTHRQSVRWLARHLDATGAFVLQELIRTVTDKATRRSP